MPDIPTYNLDKVDIDSIIKANRPDLRSVYQGVVGTNPDENAKVLRLSSQLDQPATFVHENLKEAESASKSKQLDSLWDQIDKTHPIAAKFLSDPKNMAVAHDDVPNILDHESLIGELKAAHSIIDSIQAGFQGSTTGLKTRGKMPDIYLPGDAPIYHRLASQVAGLAGDFPLMTAGAMIGGTAAGPIGAGVGTFALPAAVKTMLEEKYQKGDVKGVQDILDRSYKIAKESAKQGLVGGLTAGVGGIAGKLVGGTVGPLAAEIATMTTAGKAVEGQLPSPSDFLETAILVGGMHGAGAIGDMAVERWAQNRKAEANMNFFKAMGDTAEASKLKGRLSDAHKALIQDLTGDTPVENAYVPVQSWDKYFQANGNDPAQVANEMGLQKAYTEAKATGNDVQVPYSTFMDKLVRTKHYQGLAGDVKFDRDGMTLNQINEQRETIGKQLEVTQSQADFAIKKDAKVKAQHDMIYEGIKKQLEDSGFLEGSKDRKKMIDANAKAAAAHYTAEASRRGIMPQELYSKVAPTITGAGPDQINVTLIHHGDTPADEAKEPDPEIKAKFPDVTAEPQVHGKRLMELPLSEGGVQQVEAAKASMKNIKFSKIISSESERTKQTAGIFGESISDSRLNAIDIGDRAGLPISAFTPFLRSELQKAAQDSNYRMFGRETFPEFQKRVDDAFKDYAAEVEPGDHIGFAVSSDVIQLKKLQAENGGKPISGDQILRMVEKEGIRPASLERFQYSSSTGRIASGEGLPSESRLEQPGKQIAELPADAQAARETLLSEGPFVRAYPYTHSIEGKPFTVKTQADDLALHESLQYGGDPADPTFRKERSKVYHDLGHDALFESIKAKKAGKDTTASTEKFNDAMYKMTLLLHGTELPPESTPKWILDARTAAERQRFEQQAYHGSPYKFEKFALQKIGSGEGAQQYGWGLYFAGNKEVAEYYRDSLTKVPADYKLKGKSVMKMYDSPQLRDQDPDWAGVMENILLHETPADLREHYTEANGYSKELVKRVRAIKDEDLKAYDEDGKEISRGYLYKVDIPEDKEFLDIEKPLSKQSDSIRAALKKAFEKIDDDFISRREDEYNTDFDKWTGQQFYGALVNYASETPLPVDKASITNPQESASRYLASLGVPGLKYFDERSRAEGKGTSNYVVFDEKFIKGQERLLQGERGFFDVGQKTIALLKAADASTFMHESAHAWLQDSFQFVKSGQADEAYLKHWESARDWLGIKDDQASLTREQQEKFARGFEAYLREGNAPSEGLRMVFNRFRQWLTQIYRQIKGSPLDVDLNQNVRDFMDRMLASEEEIARASQEAGYQPSEIAELPDAPDQAKRQIRTLQERAREKAENALMSEQIKELDKDQRAFVDQQKTRLTEEAKKQVLENPIFLAADEIGPKAMPKEGEPKFLNDLIAGKLDDEKELGRMEIIAATNGFDDARDMAQQIVSAWQHGGADTEINMRVEEGMKPYSDLRNRDAIRDKARELIHSTRSIELLALEQQILSEMQNKQEIGQEVRRRSQIAARATAEAAKQQARGLLASKPYSEASAFRPYFTAERQAAVRVSKALADGDYIGAAEAKNQQMLNHALAAEAIRNGKEISKNLQFFGNFSKRGNDLLKMPYSFTRQIDDLLAQRGLAEPRQEDLTTQQKIAENMESENAPPEDIVNRTGMLRGADGKWHPESLSEFVTRVNENYYAIQLPDSIMQTQQVGKLYQLRPDITMGELRDLQEAVKIINGIGRDFEGFLSGFIKGDLRTNAAAFKKSVEANIGRPYGDIPAFGNLDMGKVASAVDAIKRIPDGMISDKVNLLTLCEYLDRLNPDGLAKNNIYRPLRAAENIEQERRAKAAKQLDAIRNKYYEKNEIARMRKDIVSKWQVNTPSGVKPMNLTKENILVLALNSGNAINIDRMEKGFGVPYERIKQETDRLSKSDWDFVQDVWKFVDSFWPEAKALEMRIKGVEPEKVKAQPVDTPHGRYEGGYYPLSYDFEKSADAYKNAEQRNALYKEYSIAAAHTEQGHLQARVASLSRPVRLTFDGLFNHLDDVIHDIAYRPSVIDVARFLNQQDAKTAIINAIGIDGYRKIGEDLKAAASTQTEFLTPADKKMRWFRFGTTFATLGYRMVIFPRRLVEDVANSMREVGFQNAIGATSDYMMNPNTTRDFVRSKSILMQDRAINRERDLIDMAKRWKGEDSWMKQFAFLQDTIADQAMSYPVWSAVYKSNVEKLGEDRARQLADESIIKTFGSGSILDRVAVQRGGELNRIISMYYSWHSMMFNRAWLQGKIAGLDYNEGNYGKALATIAGTTAMTWLVPAANEIFWGELFRNVTQGQEDENKKQKRIISRALEVPFAYFPMARNIASYGIPELIGEKGRNYRLSPIEDAIENITKTVAQGGNRLFDNGKEYDEKFMENAARSAAVAIGYPQQLNTWVFNFVDWLNNEGEANWKDLVTRKVKK